MINWIIRSKAPLRIGLAGGGTDVSPYSDLFGGAVLNATINMYAYATIEPKENGEIILNSIDLKKYIKMKAEKKISACNPLKLIKGVYNRIVKDYIKHPLSFKLTTYVDVPPGSGLGSSSTLVVAVIGAFVEWLKLPLGSYEIAHLAYEVEREDLKMSGGKQDQYSATFGGFNFMEFSGKDKVIVNPLRIPKQYLNEFQFNFLLFYNNTSRLSSKIINTQSENIKSKKKRSIEAMHKLKEQAILMKEVILKGDYNKIGEILEFGWKYKKKTAACISNKIIDNIYNTAIEAGSTGGKVSGAGGGGFMIFYCPYNTRYQVVDSLKNINGEFKEFEFTKYGLTHWTIR